MIEVGAGGGIGGSPAVVEGAAAAITTAAATMTDAGRDIGDHGDAVVARWSGTTADAAHSRIRHLAQRTDVGAQVVCDLPKILTDYAGELRAAQAEHAAAVAAAVLARASLTQAQDAVAGAAAMDEGSERAAAMRSSGQAHAHATEAVAASCHTIDAAIAREHVANEAAAAAVTTLTALLAGFTPTDPGASPTSVRAVEATDGYTDTGSPKPAAADPDQPRTAFDVMTKVYGEGPAGIDLSDQEQTDAQLDTAANWYAGIGDEGYDFASGAAALGLLATPGGALALPWYLNASEAFKERLVGAGGADTASQEYQLGADALLAASIATGLPGLGRGAAAIAGRVSERTAARAAERQTGELAARVETDHATALTDDAAREVAAQRAVTARAQSLEDAASSQMATKMGRSLDDWRNVPTVPGRPGVPAPAGGRSTPLGHTSMETLVDPIGGGHSFPKHVVTQQEFPGVSDEETLKTLIRDVISRGEAKEIRPGVHAYWKDGVIVINDPANKDLGTVFVPTKGYDYFYGL